MYHKLRKWLLLLLSFICTSPNSHFSLQTHVLIILKENTVRKKWIHKMQKLERQVDIKAFFRISDT